MCHTYSILSEGIDAIGLVKCHTYSILSEGIDVSGLVKCHIYSVLAERNVCGTINFCGQVSDLIVTRQIKCDQTLKLSSDITES
jgi:hypothetical protein